MYHKYCRWFRNPAPLEVGNFSHYLRRVLCFSTIQTVVGLGISSNHQRRIVVIWAMTQLTRFLVTDPSLHNRNTFFEGEGAEAEAGLVEVFFFRHKKFGRFLLGDAATLPSFKTEVFGKIWLQRFFWRKKWNKNTCVFIKTFFKHDSFFAQMWSYHLSRWQLVWQANWWHFFFWRPWRWFNIEKHIYLVWK